MLAYAKTERFIFLDKQVYSGNAYAIDGCAIFFRRDRFSHVKKYEVSLCRRKRILLLEIAHAELLIFTQVEFNKAAQSLTEAVVPSAQKKSALGRLLKVIKLHFYNGFVCKIFSFVYVEFTCCIYRIMLH